MFRPLSGISRLLLQNVGLKRHGRRSLSFSLYSGSHVADALSPQAKSTSTKSNIAGGGFEGGKPVMVGCSRKGRIWTKDQGNLTEFFSWAHGIGAKLNDAAITTDDIIENVLLPKEITAFPDDDVLCIDWPDKLREFSDERVRLVVGDSKFVLADFSLGVGDVSQGRSTLEFSISHEDFVLGFKHVLGGEAGFRVEQVSGERAFLLKGSQRLALDEWLTDYPLDVVFVDASELVEGCALVELKRSRQAVFPSSQIEVWDWTGIDIRKESLWKAGAKRLDSVQARAADVMKRAGYDVIFDDDGAGEAADLVCVAERADHIDLALVHCKFAGGASPGERIKDVVEVCSQAVRSSRWQWRFEHLCQHVMGRESRRRKKVGSIELPQRDDEHGSCAPQCGRLSRGQNSRHSGATRRVERVCDPRPGDRPRGCPRLPTRHRRRSTGPGVQPVSLQALAE